MPELRKDAVTRRWVIIAPERNGNPDNFSHDHVTSRGEECPFCPGNEGLTPHEILAYRSADTGPDESGWWIRVVPNRYPALVIEGELNRSGVGMYDRMDGIGAHEVIIETPQHEGDFYSYGQEQVENIFWAYRDRYLDLTRDKRFKYILIFKNVGQAAGASLEHPHSQLIATPVMPKRVQEELAGAEFYYTFKERCVFCDIVRQEIEDGQRLVYESSHFVVFAPFASRFPFELWVVPKEHWSSFGHIDESLVPDLAHTMMTTLQGLSRLLHRPPFNYVLHTSPCKTPEMEHYHWHIEIIPRLIKMAGFEWGTGFYINPTEPERAANLLREVCQRSGG